MKLHNPVNYSILERSCWKN